MRALADNWLTSIRSISSALRFEIERRLWPSDRLSGPLIRRRTPAVARHHRDEMARLSRSPSSLNHHEARFFSQNGEDGILDEIFRRLGLERGCFLEIGADDGEENCTRHLLVDRGWHGVWVEGDLDRVAHATATFGQYAVRTRQAIVTRENSLEIVTELGIMREVLDLLVIDVDGNDYWLFERLVPALRPKVIVVEYNAWFGPRAWWVMRYDATHRWDKTARHGASIAPYHELARRLGYRLVAGDISGVNLFFVRDDLAALAAHVLPSLSPVEAYHAPKYEVLGHPPARPASGRMEALSTDESSAIELAVDRVSTTGPVAPEEPIFHDGVDPKRHASHPSHRPSPPGQPCEPLVRP